MSRRISRSVLAWTLLAASACAPQDRGSAPGEAASAASALNDRAAPFGTAARYWHIDTTPPFCADSIRLCSNCGVDDVSYHPYNPFTAEIVDGVATFYLPKGETFNDGDTVVFEGDYPAALLFAGDVTLGAATFDVLAGRTPGGAGGPGGERRLRGRDPRGHRGSGSGRRAAGRPARTSSRPRRARPPSAPTPAS